MNDVPISASAVSAPVRGIAQNVYLRGAHFWAMLCAAVVAHLAVLGIYSMLPEPEVTAIPVQALSFKIGNQEHLAAYGLEQAVARDVAAMPQADSQTLPDSFEAEDLPVATVVAKQARTLPPRDKSATSATETARADQPAIYQMDAPRQRPEENEMAEATVPEFAAIAPPPPLRVPLAEVAIAPDPQRFVRQTGLAPSLPLADATDNAPVREGNLQGSMGGSGAVSYLTPEAVADIKLRYEQLISNWLAKHMLYPKEAGRATGRVLVRVQLDRQGYLRYYTVERGSGNVHLDRAATDMVRRANPFPAPPSDYPSGNLNEFRIPVLFEAP